MNDKDKKERLLKCLQKKYFKYISFANFIIYSVGLLISFAFLGVYFINPENHILVVLMSIGASLIGAIVLAFSIEWSNQKNVEKHKSAVRMNQLRSLMYRLNFVLNRTAWLFFEVKKLTDKALNQETIEDDKVYFITFENLWVGLKNLITIYEFTFFDNDTYAPTVTKIDKITQNAIDSYHNIFDYASEVSDSMKTFEATGYFTSNETEAIKTVVTTLTILFRNDHFIYQGVDLMFSNLSQIQEFAYFNECKFYYKNGEVVEQKQIAKLQLTQEKISTAIEILP